VFGFSKLLSMLIKYYFEEFGGNDQENFISVIDRVFIS